MSLLENYVRCIRCGTWVDAEKAFVVDTHYDSDGEGWEEDCVCSDCYEEALEE